MGSYANRQPPRLLVINCLPDYRGLFKHTVFEDRKKITHLNVSEICADPMWLGLMRTDTEKFLAQFCIEDEDDR